jgi:glycosyltransferase involved in cell wall biosynthesis
MRVAIDGRTLQEHNSGIARVVGNILPTLADRADVQLLLDDRLSRRLNADVPAKVEVVRLRAPLPRGPAWLQLAVPAHLRGSDCVFHCPFYALPYLQPVPMVVTFHDLTFEHEQNWLPPHKRVTWRTQARHAARTARRILTDSRVVRTEVIERYGVPEERVIAVSLSVDRAFKSQPDGTMLAARLEAMGLTRPYVVAIGGARRRNLAAAVEAMRIVHRQGLDHELVVVGAEPVPPEPWLRCVGAVDDATLALVLAGAEVFCFPTQYEGFGMPAVEALACGTGVICARVGSLLEVVGDAAEWCDDFSAEAVAAALVRVLADPDRVRDLRLAAARATAALPTWEEVAEAHLRVYAQALGEETRS